jgi:hypothetical protein
MSLRVEPKLLKVTLYTNIPVGNDYEKDILTFGTLISPELKNVRVQPTQYPFFTFQTKYDETVLGFYSYDEIVRTFFKKDLFLSRLCNSGNIIPYKKDDLDNLVKLEEIGEDKDSVNKKIRENINNNIMLMLKYLLPTKWPVINNHFNSYDLFKLKDSMGTLFFNPFISRKYVNLKLSSGVYSLKKVVWLNDMLNLIDKIDDTIYDDARNQIVKYSNQRTIDKTSTEQDYEEVKSCYKKKCKDSDLVYLGIQIDSDQYEASVDVELFEGEIKEGEEKNIKCPYYNDFLGEQLKVLMRPRRKEEYSRLGKNPLYSIQSKMSKKKGFIEKEEVDEKTKEKRKEEDSEYNEIDEKLRRNYEVYSNPFFEQQKQGRLKAKIKKYDINTKNFYAFLQQNLNPFLKFITQDSKNINELDDKVKLTLTDKRGYQLATNLNITDYIEKKMEQYADDKTKKQITKEVYDEIKLKYDLTIEFIKLVKSKSSGGKTQKRHRIKNRRTRRRY